MKFRCIVSVFCFVSIFTDSMLNGADRTEKTEITKIEL